MKYTFRGTLCGYICNDCKEPLSNVSVKIYRSGEGRNITADAAARPKETFTIVDEDALEAKRSRLIAEAGTDDKGNFSFELGEDQRYNGEAFEIDVYCETVPHLKATRNRPEPVQFSITTLQPDWQVIGRESVYVYNYCLPFRYWCGIRGRFGAWTICGHLTAKKQPLPGAVVEAFDADWLQDDSLGSATTDASGHFRIDYTTADFKLTPFSGINIEFASGPDVYFKAKFGNIMVIDEIQADGRQPGRENIGHCFCVELNTEKIQSPNVIDLPLWQQVGAYYVTEVSPTGSELGFSKDGFAGVEKHSFAFGSNMPLKGNLPLRNFKEPANPLEYRFMIGEWTWEDDADELTSLPTVAPALEKLKPVLQLAPTQVGNVKYVDDLGTDRTAPVNIDTSDFKDEEGWIKIEGKTVNVTMSDGTNSTITVDTSNFNHLENLFILDSSKITPPPKFTKEELPKGEAGRTITESEREPVRRYTLKFEVRDSKTLKPITGKGFGDVVLRAIVIDNSPLIVALNLEELFEDACLPLPAEEIHILYTVDHPLLRKFNIQVLKGNGAIIHGLENEKLPPEFPLELPVKLPVETFVLPPPANNLLIFRGGQSGEHQDDRKGGFALDISADPVCAYELLLHCLTAHRGWEKRRILYCKRDED